MSVRRYFITGTDTDAGKTLIACGLLAAARSTGLSTAAIKPVAAGASRRNGRLENDDAMALLAQCSEAISYSELNPVCFEPAIAPHIAAAAEGKTITAQSLLDQCTVTLRRNADLTLVEGAGGWLVPLNENETLADFAQLQHQHFPMEIILVVRIQLGCINHALLSAESIRAKGLKLAAWVANCVHEMPRLKENIKSLEQQLDAPCLGVVPPLQNTSAEEVASYLVLPEAAS